MYRVPMRTRGLKRISSMPVNWSSSSRSYADARIETTKLQMQHNTVDIAFLCGRAD
ncbi:hypothetical protein HMPREF7545_1562 [Selenomonas noxia ATCC 43541]|nr:hypothetical protein HMPREF7545_1562 [Selenomonas noxia ATCC 43541]